MLKEFSKSKKRNLLFAFGLWSFVVAIKIFWPETVAESRYRLAINIIALVGLPAMIAGEWANFKKAKKGNNTD